MAAAFALTHAQHPFAIARARRRARLKPSRAEAPSYGLAFARAGGPVLCVAALCGGAGASTLTYLVGAVAALSSRAPVLALDTGGPTAGLALYAQVRSERTLAESSELLAGGQELPGSLFATERHGLRVIAGAPQFKVAGAPQGIRRVLEDARAAHGLTVIDAGTLAREAERVALAGATHVAWILPATVSASIRARRVLAKIAPLPARELVIARLATGERKAPLSELAALAEARRAPLVLMPHIDEIAGRSVQEAAAQAQVSLQALGGWLAR